MLRSKENSSSPPACKYIRYLYERCPNKSIIVYHYMPMGNLTHYPALLLILLTLCPQTLLRFTPILLRFTPIDLRKTIQNQSICFGVQNNGK